MGRGKIEIKKIENVTNRRVTFCKRKMGLQKKANELSILCDADVALVIFSSSGKMYRYSSPGSSIDQIVEKYVKDSRNKLMENHITTSNGENASYCILRRDITGEDLETLSVNELRDLEEQLEMATSRVRERMNHLMEDKFKNLIVELEESRRRLRYYEDAIRRKTDHIEMISGRGASLGQTVTYSPIEPDTALYLTPSAPVFHVHQSQLNMQEETDCHQPKLQW